MLKAVIFDLDGVLTSTSLEHFRAWKKLADEENIHFTRKDNEALRGVSREESLLRLLKGKKVTPNKFREMMDRKNSYYQEMLKKITSKDLYPGATKLLKFLRRKKIKVAIGSASKNTKTVLNQLKINHLIDFIGDGYLVKRPKPAPDLFLEIAKNLKLKPKNCLVVEDAKAGVVAAHKAGMKCIGIGKSAKKAEYLVSSIGTISPTKFLQIANSLI